MSLDPQVASMLAMLDAGFPPVQDMTAAQARAAIRSKFVHNPNPESVAEVTDRRSPSREVRSRSAATGQT